MHVNMYVYKVCVCVFNLHPEPSVSNFTGTSSPLASMYVPFYLNV